MSSIKLCNTCNRELSIEMFVPSEPSICRECHARKSKAYYESHKERLYMCNREWIKNHPEQVAKYSHKYSTSTKGRNKSNARYRVRYKTDPNFRLKLKIKNMIHRVLDYKTDRTLAYIGCSLEDLKKHLSNTAHDNGYHTFDINNMNGYDIDHIVPVTKFVEITGKKIEECNYFKNLQILSKIDNIKKSNII